MYVEIVQYISSEIEVEKASLSREQVCHTSYYVGLKSSKQMVLVDMTDVSQS